MPDLPVTNGVTTLLPPPEGYEVNFDNPRRNGDVTCYILTSVGSFLAICFLGQRLFVKGIVRKRLTYDDGAFVVIGIPPQVANSIRSSCTSMGELKPLYRLIGSNTALRSYSRLLYKRLLSVSALRSPSRSPLAEQACRSFRVPVHWSPCVGDSLHQVPGKLPCTSRPHRTVLQVTDVQVVRRIHT
jgi:hypothetical protein